MSSSSSVNSTRRPPFALALLLFAAWTAITVGGGLLQAGETTTLDALVSSGIVWAIPGAALFLLLPALLFGWTGAFGLRAPTTSRAALLPSLFVLAMLGLALANGLPAGATLGILLVNALFVGLSEELAFRGLLLDALLARFGTTRAVVLGALAFGAVHSLNALLTGETGPALAQSALAVGMGLWAGYLRLRTGSLLAPILLHGLWDFALLLSLAGGGAATGTALVAAVALGGAVLLGIWGYRSLRRLAQA